METGAQCGEINGSQVSDTGAQGPACREILLLPLYWAREGRVVSCWRIRPGCISPQPQRSGPRLVFGDWLPIREGPVRSRDRQPGASRCLLGMVCDAVLGDASPRGMWCSLHEARRVSSRDLAVAHVAPAERGCGCEPPAEGRRWHSRRITPRV